ncbi:flagellar basal body P-ring protein FlgI [Cognatazoarcus halotolerans]|uniref:flagellar basal body P-ring protein FlgI n=1 Tax=Cognatazoarcus halotolerans TaxID=2686016 RepID=UPI0013569764|nr:flagellar basal body P-ring protein FlgI [Cognatazoarcus halotolerans]MBX3679215.1 flagellar basal body P-ring protein FlgI [Rhodocyclaceae bacterium]MCB1901962.1 flagellar basal body P-ring protein FlgI [Rhodocyclaceae bacterium]MCP5310032.1 flagellar basal body P-ring protein FlgI [Zoogloeaceae bacterium]
MTSSRCFLTTLRRVAVVLSVFLALVPAARAERLKDLASIAGVRDNQLIGYGLVVGLDGSGDQTTQTPFTVQSIINMLGNMGVTMPPGTSLQLKNVAAVMVTANLPPFARPGQQIDVTVSSMGNAKSLRGGTLLMTPLKGADGQVYALGQGNVVIGGAGASGGGASKTINHLSAGRVPGGATVERSVPTALGQGEFVHLELNDNDFGTAQRVVDAINAATFPGTAQALDGRTIQVRAPQDSTSRVAFIGRLEGLDVTPAQQVAKVIVNSRTGSVVMNQAVALQNCAVAHGNLSVTVGTETTVSQPNPLSGGQTVVGQRGNVDVQQAGASLINVKSGANLSEVVKALNAVGANPMDLISILQAMKSVGALRAELEVI